MQNVGMFGMLCRKKNQYSIFENTIYLTGKHADNLTCSRVGIQTDKLTTDKQPNRFTDRQTSFNDIRMR